MAIRKGDRIVVRTKNGEVTAKEVKKQAAGRIELKALNPAHEDRAFALDDLAWMARIVWVSQ